MTITPTFERELSRICDRVGVTLPIARGKDVRFTHVQMARAACYVWLKRQGWSYPAIGDYFGGRDHTTVISTIRTWERKVGSRGGVRRGELMLTARRGAA